MGSGARQDGRGVLDPAAAKRLLPHQPDGGYRLHLMPAAGARAAARDSWHEMTAHAVDQERTPSDEPPPQLEPIRPALVRSVPAETRLDRPSGGMERPPPLAGGRGLVRLHVRARSSLSQSLGGIKSVSITASGAPQTEAGQAAEAMNSGGAAASTEELDVVVTSGSLRATDPAFRATIATILGRLTSATASVGGTTGPALAEMADPYAAPPTAGFLSPDLTSVRIVGRIAGDAAALETRSQSIASVLASLQRDFPSYQIHAIGMTLFADQIAEEINRDFDGSLAISLPATFLILLIAFGAVVAAGVPLVYAVSALCGAFGLFGIFSRTVEPVSPFAAQFIVLVGLAVAVDYSLFMITRFRSERRAGRDKLEAIEVASATSGRAVLFSGMAVMVSLAGLFLLPDSLFQSIAIGTIAVIFVSMVGSLLFMPAMLSILGDGVNRGGIPLLARLRSGGGSDRLGASGPRSSAASWAIQSRPPSPRRPRSCCWHRR